MGEGRGGGGAQHLGRDAKESAYTLQRGLGIRQHLSITEAQDAKTLRRDPGIARTVLFPPSRMIVRATVDLDDYAAFEAREVDDERTYRHLPAKSVVGNLSFAQSSPQFPLAFSRRFTQCPRAFVCHNP